MQYQESSIESGINLNNSSLPPYQPSMSDLLESYQPKVPMVNSKVEIHELFRRKAEQQLGKVKVSKKKPANTNDRSLQQISGTKKSMQISTRNNNLKESNSS